MSNFNFLFDMEKMTVRDLQCKLYVETLREEYQNRDYMFTTIGEEMQSRIERAIEKKVEEIEQKEALSDEKLKNTWDNEFESIDDIRERLARAKEHLLGERLDDLQQMCSDRDFALALLLTCWKEKFALDKPSDAEIVNSYIQHELRLDAGKFCKSVIVENYKEYPRLNEKIAMLKNSGEIDSLIRSYLWHENVLEIDTDFYDKSTKMLTRDVDYVISKVYRDLIEGDYEVLRFNESIQLPEGETFYTIVAHLSSCKDRSLNGMLEFFRNLAVHAKYDSGRIILIDTERILASDDMYEFRKKMIEESLLEIYISGWYAGEDVYILRTIGAPENSVFNFVCWHQHYLSGSDNFLALHNKLTKNDVRSIDYNFEATSDLLTGQQGRAYSFRELFSVPKTGVEERELSGVYPVFQMKDMPHDFCDAVKNSADLDECEISGSFKILTEDKLVFFVGDDKIQCCYIEASEAKPVFVSHQFAVLDITSEILTPKYVQILCAKGILDKVFDNEGSGRNWYRYTDCSYDEYVGKEYLYTPEDKIRNLSSMIQIPSKEQQSKELVDAQFINASAVERERALEMLLAEKTWLNEEHIRNIKHRIGNELLPVKNDVDAMFKVLQNHPEGITLDTIRGKDEKVSEILERLTRCIAKVNESLQDLTRTVDKGNLKPVDIVATINDFEKDAVCNQTFKLCHNIPEKRIYVNGSTNMINSILRNIVDNAVRHGFIDKTRRDYAVEISIHEDGNGNCVLDVKNNGAPMSELARDSYFKRGSVVGLTGHSGIGGADVKDTANAMGGDATLPVEDGEWAVCVRISLPILNTEKI